MGRTALGGWTVEVCVADRSDATAPTCKSSGAGEETRTPGLLITSELLYRLSYSGDGGDSITAAVYGVARSGGSSGRQ